MNHIVTPVDGASQAEGNLPLAPVSCASPAEADKLAQEIVDTVRMPLVVLDSEMRVHTANRSFYHLFHTSQAEVEQRRFFDLNDRLWDTPRLRELLDQAWAHELPPEDLEIQIEFPLFGEKIMLLHARRLIHQGQDADMTFLGIEDITERRRIEEQVQVYVRRLERSNRELQDFAYIASHDLQEPLRAIQSFGERLRRWIGPEFPEEGRDSLDRMLRAAMRMRELVGDLLELSRITTKARPFVPVDLNDVVKLAWADLSQRAKETAGCLHVELLPTVQADSTQMRQLMQNLIDNALKYGRAGVAPQIELHAALFDGVSADEPGRIQPMARIEVQDNGIGFEEKYAERIFSPFQRLHGRSRYDGTGIGLAICRKIVERHGGRITAKSTPGDGSLFTVLMPMRPADVQ